jgi:hypothetical protein
MTTPSNTDNAAFCAKQPLRLRVWQFLGFCRQYDDDLFEWRNAEGDGFAPSAFHTETHCILGWKDRLRVLVTGHVAVDVWSKTDVIVGRAVSRSSVAVLPPIRTTELVRE